MVVENGAGEPPRVEVYAETCETCAAWYKEKFDGDLGDPPVLQ